MIKIVKWFYKLLVKYFINFWKYFSKKFTIKYYISTNFFIKYFMQNKPYTSYQDRNNQSIKYK